MKYLVHVLIVLVSYCNAYGFENKKTVSCNYLSSSFEQVENTLKKVFVQHTTIDSDSSEGTPLKQKKRNRKGVKPMLFCISTDSVHKKEVTDNSLILSVQLSYYFQKFPGNGKRGPPSVV
ncbi:MAG: hypothetical protein V4608_01515 [Bacteroidota bacterium]